MSKSRFKCPLCRENLDVIELRDDYRIHLSCSVPECPARAGVTANSEVAAIEILEHQFPPPTTH